MVHFASPIPHSPRLASPRLTHDREVDLGLPAAQLVFHHQCVAATVLLARCQDGELAAALTVLHFDVLALLDLRVKAGVRMEAPPHSTTSTSPQGWMGQGAGSGACSLFSGVVVHTCNATAGGAETGGCLGITASLA